MTSGGSRAARARAVLSTVLDVVGLVAIPVGAGIVAGLGVGLVVLGVLALFAAWRLA